MAFTATTLNSAGAWRPDGYAFAAADVLPDSLYLQCTTKAGEIQGDMPVCRVAYIDDAAAEFTAEGTEIPESEPDLAEVLVATGKVSQLIRLSREQFVQPQTADQLSQSVARAVQRRADLAFVQQAAPTPPALGPSTGLGTIAGLVDGGEVTENLDALVDLVAELQENLSNPSLILMSPTAWAEFRKLKVGAPATNSSLIGAGTTDAEQLLLSLPVLVNVAVPPLSGFVIDKSAVVSAYGTVNVNTSDHQFFSSDSVAVRCTWRVGHNVVRPNRIGKFTIAATVFEGS
ncbi:major capsid protein [Mycolicibacterium porcinum]|uniref:phage major capsid protein n=1 Tax=Mycolicibacterium porcinum TaxID=39693 RepID=UPI00080BFA05|nr:phage major capsid protein [Mycolicibacterium porcinum]OCB14149.1 major capsid protein [Mycolicibacterium porcinum]